MVVACEEKSVALCPTEEGGSRSWPGKKWTPGQEDAAVPRSHVTQRVERALGISPMSDNPRRHTVPATIALSGRARPGELQTGYRQRGAPPTWPAAAQPSAMSSPGQTLPSLRSDRRRGRRAQEGIGADTPFEGHIFPTSSAT